MTSAWLPHTPLGSSDARIAPGVRTQVIEPNRPGALRRGATDRHEGDVPRWTGRRSSVRPLDALEHDDGNLPLGPFLILSVVRPDAVHPPPEPLTLLTFGRPPLEHESRRP